MSLPNPLLALLIGVDDYEHLPELRWPGQDVLLLRDTLQRLGFECTTLTRTTGPVDAARIRDAMAALRRRIQELPRDTVGSPPACVVLYFAGHGAVIAERSHLLGQTADPAGEGLLRTGAVPVDEVIAELGVRREVPKILLIDACQAPLRSRAFEPAAHTVGVLPGEMLVDFATQPGEMAADGDSHSPYALALSEHLGDPVSIGDVLVRVRARVRALTGQAQSPLTFLSLGVPVCLARPAGLPGQRHAPIPPNAVLAAARERIRLIHSRDESGRWAWYAVLVHPGRQHDFEQAVTAEAPVRLDDHGTVLAAAYGAVHSGALRMYLKQRYGL
jgi:hypothetical protein